MFTSKQTSLEQPVSKAQTKTSNKFITGSMKKAAITTSLGNGAVKFTTTGNDFVDQFGKITNYKAPRAYSEIAKDMQLLYSQDKLKAIQLTFYIRLITRTVALPDGSKTETVQRGQGLKHEGIFRMMWLELNHPEDFWANINLFVAVGGWKDIFTMLSYDLQYNGWDGKKLDWKKFGDLIFAGLANENQVNLVKKYLPQIKAKSQAKSLEAQADNLIGKFICWNLVGSTKGEHGQTYKTYRKFKTSGTAHEWQKLISKKTLKDINFETIHGRALAQLVGSKFLKNNGLETKYQTWIASKPVAKFTGFAYELFKPLGSSVNNASGLQPYQKDTINKQFLGLVETAKKDMEGLGSFIVVMDTSGSMTSATAGTGVSAYAIAKTFALYFSYLLKGAFENHWLEFSETTVMKTWKGNTPIDKLVNDHSDYVGSTNFASVGQHFVKMLKSGVPESDFPTGILCVSDGCFNSAGSNKTQTQSLLQTLRNAGFSKEYVDNFKIVLWDVPNGYYGKAQTAFEGFADTPNLFHMSGLDGAGIAFVTGVKGQEKVPTTAEELFEAAMNQEVLNLIVA